MVGLDCARRIDAGILGCAAGVGRQQDHAARSAGTLFGLHAGRFRDGIAQHHQGRSRQPRVHEGRIDRGHQSQYEVMACRDGAARRGHDLRA